MTGFSVGIQQGFKNETLWRLHGNKPASPKVPDNFSRFVHFFLRICYRDGRHYCPILFGCRQYRSNHFAGNPWPCSIVYQYIAYAFIRKR